MLTDLEQLQLEQIEADPAGYRDYAAENAATQDAESQFYEFTEPAMVQPIVELVLKQLDFLCLTWAETKRRPPTMDDPYWGVAYGFLAYLGLDVPDRVVEDLADKLKERAEKQA